MKEAGFPFSLQKGKGWPEAPKSRRRQRGGSSLPLANPCLRLARKDKDQDRFPSPFLGYIDLQRAMTLRKSSKPTSPGRRHLYLLDRRPLSKEKALVGMSYGLSKKGGRNNRGRVTVGQRGGGHKRKYRIIDFKRTPRSGRVVGIEHDPNRSAWIARVACPKISGEEDYYILAPHTLSPGEEVSSEVGAPLKVGNSLPLRDLPLGATLHNLEMHPGKGGQLIRAAGSSGLLTHKGKDRARVRLPSGLQPYLSLDCRATLGSLGNKDAKNQSLGKAGRSRWLGRRPTVRGVAMNPIDHPHGGGEGKSSGGRPSVTPWGKPTKGSPTRSKNTRKRALRIASL
jgi:large subunit ribosomal protein L2